MYNYPYNFYNETIADSAVMRIEKWIGGKQMSPSTITLLFLLFAVVMFVLEKIPLGVTSMIVCIGLTVTGVLDVQTAFAGFIDSNVILFVAMFIVG